MGDALELGGIARCGSSRPLSSNEWVYWSGVRERLLRPGRQLHQPGAGGHDPGQPGIGIHANTVCRHEPLISTCRFSSRTRPQRVSAQFSASLRRMAQRAQRRHPGLCRAKASVTVTDLDRGFGDGSRKTFRRIANPSELTTTHTYGSGQFDVEAIAHVTGEAYGAFSRQTGRPTSAPFRSRSTSATARADRSADRVPPARRDRHRQPIGNAANGTLTPADAVGQAHLYWPRGLRCSLFPRAGHREGGIRTLRAVL